MKHIAVLGVLLFVLLVSVLPAQAQDVTDCTPGSPECYCLGCPLDLFAVGDFVFSVRGDTFPSYVYTVERPTDTYWLPGFAYADTLHTGAQVTIVARLHWLGNWAVLDHAVAPMYIRVE